MALFSSSIIIIRVYIVGDFCDFESKPAIKHRIKWIINMLYAMVLSCRKRKL